MPPQLTIAQGRPAPAQARALHVPIVAVADPDAAEDLRRELPAGTQILCGADAAQQMIESHAQRGDMVLAAMVGAAGIAPVMAASLVAKRPTSVDSSSPGAPNSSMAFTFQRPTRFLDLEGGAAIFADPIEIADRYHTAVTAYLEALRRIVLEKGIDYQRVLTDEPYEQVLARFLVGRAAARGLR